MANGLWWHYLCDGYAPQYLRLWWSYIHNHPRQHAASPPICPLLHLQRPPHLHAAHAGLSEYAHKRKPLRVTNRTGHQRSTYRLQVPYRYGIPLLIVSGTLQWLLSQILFLARVDTFDSDGTIDSANSFSSVGYSPIAIVTFLILSSSLVIAAYYARFRTYKPGIPMLGPCSAAISASCHRPVDDVDAANWPVQWGAVETEGSVGHCCFTSHDVSLPDINRLYS